jgi:hypothetical protein
LDTPKFHGYRDTIVYKAVVLHDTKHFKVFETVVFLITIVFPINLEKTKLPNRTLVLTGFSGALLI